MRAISRLGSLVACQVPPQRRGLKTCTTALRAAVVTSAVAGKSAGPKHLLRGFSPLQCASIWSPHPSRLDAGIRMAAFSFLTFSSALAVEVEPIVKVTQKIIDRAAQ